MICLHSQRGFVTLLMLLVLAFLTAQVFMLFIKVETRAKMVQYEAQQIKASYAADSGLEYARALLDKDTFWEEVVFPLSGGEVKIVLIEKAPGYRVTAKAQIGKIVQIRYVDYVQSEGKWLMKDYGELYD